MIFLLFCVICIEMQHMNFSGKLHMHLKPSTILGMDFFPCLCCMPQKCIFRVCWQGCTQPIAIMLSTQLKCAIYSFKVTAALQSFGFDMYYLLRKITALRYLITKNRYLLGHFWTTLLVSRQNKAWASSFDCPSSFFSMTTNYKGLKDAFLEQPTHL